MVLTPPALQFPTNSTLAVPLRAVPLIPSFVKVPSVWPKFDTVRRSALSAQPKSQADAHFGSGDPSSISSASGGVAKGGSIGGGVSVSRRDARLLKDYPLYMFFANCTAMDLRSLACISEMARNSAAMLDAQVDEIEGYQGQEEMGQQPEWCHRGVVSAGISVEAQEPHVLRTEYVRGMSSPGGAESRKQGEDSRNDRKSPSKFVGLHRHQHECAVVRAIPALNAGGFGRIRAAMHLSGTFVPREGASPPHSPRKIGDDGGESPETSNGGALTKTRFHVTADGVVLPRVSQVVLEAFAQMTQSHAPHWPWAPAPRPTFFHSAQPGGHRANEAVTLAVGSSLRFDFSGGPSPLKGFTHTVSITPGTVGVSITEADDLVRGSQVDHSFSSGGAEVKPLETHLYRYDTLRQRSAYMVTCVTEESVATVRVEISNVPEGASNGLFDPAPVHTSFEFDIGCSLPAYAELFPDNRNQTRPISRVKTNRVYVVCGAQHHFGLFVYDQYARPFASFSAFPNAWNGKGLAAGIGTLTPAEPHPIIENQSPVRYSVTVAHTPCRGRGTLDTAIQWIGNQFPTKVVDLLKPADRAVLQKEAQHVTSSIKSHPNWSIGPVYGVPSLSHLTDELLLIVVPPQRLLPLLPLTDYVAGGAGRHLWGPSSSRDRHESASDERLWGYQVDAKRADTGALVVPLFYHPKWSNRLLVQFGSGWYLYSWASTEQRSILSDPFSSSSSIVDIDDAQVTPVSVQSCIAAGRGSKQTPIVLPVLRRGEATSPPEGLSSVDSQSSRMSHIAFDPSLMEPPRQALPELRSMIVGLEGVVDAVPPHHPLLPVPSVLFDATPCTVTNWCAFEELWVSPRSPGVFTLIAEDHALLGGAPTQIKVSFKPIARILLELIGEPYEIDMAGVPHGSGGSVPIRKKTRGADKGGSSSPPPVLGGDGAAAQVEEGLVYDLKVTVIDTDGNTLAPETYPPMKLRLLSAPRHGDDNRTRIQDDSKGSEHWEMALDVDSMAGRSGLSSQRRLRVAPSPLATSYGSHTPSEGERLGKQGGEGRRGGWIGGSDGFGSSEDNLMSSKYQALWAAVLDKTERAAHDIYALQGLVPGRYTVTATGINYPAERITSQPLEVVVFRPLAVTPQHLALLPGGHTYELTVTGGPSGVDLDLYSSDPTVVSVPSHLVMVEPTITTMNRTGTADVHVLATYQGVSLSEVTISVVVATPATVVITTDETGSPTDDIDSENTFGIRSETKLVAGRAKRLMAVLKTSTGLLFTLPHLLLPSGRHAGSQSELQRHPPHPSICTFEWITTGTGATGDGHKPDGAAPLAFLTSIQPTLSASPQRSTASAQSPLSSTVQGTGGMTATLYGHSQGSGQVILRVGCRLPSGLGVANNHWSGEASIGIRTYYDGSMALGMPNDHPLTGLLDAIPISPFDCMTPASLNPISSHYDSPAYQLSHPIRLVTESNYWFKPIISSAWSISILSEPDSDLYQKPHRGGRRDGHREDVVTFTKVQSGSDFVAAIRTGRRPGSSALMVIEDENKRPVSHLVITLAEIGDVQLTPPVETITVGSEKVLDLILRDIEGNVLHPPNDLFLDASSTHPSVIHVSPADISKGDSFHSVKHKSEKSSLRIEYQRTTWNIGSPSVLVVAGVRGCAGISVAVARKRSVSSIPQRDGWTAVTQTDALGHPPSLDGWTSPKHVGLTDVVEICADSALIPPQSPLVVYPGSVLRLITDPASVGLTEQRHSKPLIVHLEMRLHPTVVLTLAALNNRNVDSPNRYSENVSSLFCEEPLKSLGKRDKADRMAVLTQEVKRELDYIYRQVAPEGVARMGANITSVTIGRRVLGGPSMSFSSIGGSKLSLPCPSQFYFDIKMSLIVPAQVVLTGFASEVSLSQGPLPAAALSPNTRSRLERFIDGMWSVVANDPSLKLLRHIDWSMGIAADLQSQWASDAWQNGDWSASQPNILSIGIKTGICSAVRVGLSRVFYKGEISAATAVMVTPIGEIQAALHPLSRTLSLKRGKNLMETKTKPDMLCSTANMGEVCLAHHLSGSGVPALPWVGWVRSSSSLSNDATPINSQSSGGLTNKVLTNKIGEPMGLILRLTPPNENIISSDGESGCKGPPSRHASHTRLPSLVSTPMISQLIETECTFDDPRMNKFFVLTPMYFAVAGPFGLSTPGCALTPLQPSMEALKTAEWPPDSAAIRVGVAPRRFFPSEGSTGVYERDAANVWRQNVREATFRWPFLAALQVHYDQSIFDESKSLMLRAEMTWPVVLQVWSGAQAPSLSIDLVGGSENVFDVVGPDSNRGRGLWTYRIYWKEAATVRKRLVEETRRAGDARGDSSWWSFGSPRSFIERGDLKTPDLGTLTVATPSGQEEQFGIRFVDFEAAKPAVPLSVPSTHPAPVEEPKERWMAVLVLDMVQTAKATLNQSAIIAAAVTILAILASCCCFRGKKKRSRASIPIVQPDREYESRMYGQTYDDGSYSNRVY
eukprot:GHVN01050452.1.p1 GENE.GHVN01050452.1~~GHVN01050452.1.p1  ORF type:complete len:2597 (+),score=342.21 GHVN01050452.1:367-7791(+)